MIHRAYICIHNHTRIYSSFFRRFLSPPVCSICVSHIKQNLLIIFLRSLCLITKSVNKETCMSTCGTNHEPGSGSAFINYYLSVNTVCGTFVHDLSHTWMQRTWQGPEWILAITLHPTLPQTADCIYVNQHVLIIARIDCRYAKYGRCWWRNWRGIR